MTMDLCVEASGSIAHLLATDTLNSLLPLRWPLRRSGPRQAAGHASGLGSLGEVELGRRVGLALDRLPFLLVQVLWLVDICRCSYETAAVELGVDPDEVRLLVVEARHQLRAELEALTPPLDDDLTVRRRSS